MIESKLSTTPDGAYCPIRATLALVGQKWVPHIVYQLVGGKLRFNELAAEIGGCNSRTLRDRLTFLEAEGIVTRHIVATMPPWVEYELTDRGRELGAALASLERWGERHMRRDSARSEVSAEH
ncbi:MAG: helix-turn-helix transcriptional regulator [Dehalococcoidia bacterium]|nr:helix-turn-helix transcriptional regulator [Dehalococcoidia bacterium]